MKYEQAGPLNATSADVVTNFNSFPVYMWEIYIAPLINMIMKHSRLRQDDFHYSDVFGTV